MKCFRCSENFQTLNLFKCHFQSIHKADKIFSFDCYEQSCRRSFGNFFSLCHHIEQKHIHFEKVITGTTSSSDVVKSSFTEKSMVSVQQNSSMNNFMDVEPGCSKKIDIRDSHFSNAHYKTLEIIQKNLVSNLSDIISELYSDPNNHKKTVELFVDKLKFLLVNYNDGINNHISIFNSFLKETSPNVAGIDYNNIVNATNCSLENFATDKKRLKFLDADNGGEKVKFRKVNILRDCVSVDIGESSQTKIKSVDCVHISLSDQFRKIMSIPGMITEIKDNIAFLFKDFEKNGLISNFIQGKLWREQMKEHGDKFVLPLFIYHDDFQSGNLNGSQANNTKVGGTYANIPCLPVKYLSKVEFIVVTLLFFSKDKKTVSETCNVDANKLMFQPLIDELIDLRENGISIVTENGTETIYFELGLLIGDNLGLHSILNLVESFSANFPCRYCKAQKELLQILTFEMPFLLRNEKNHLEDISKNNPSETGIKGPCIWHQIRTFKFPQNVSIDVMHDVLTGVCCYILYSVLDYIINKQKFLSIEDFNHRVQSFKVLLTLSETSNLPPVINASSFQNCIFGMSASETLFLVHNLGVIIGDIVPEDDEYWELYLLHAQIVSILMSPKMCENDVKLYEFLVSKHHKLYIELTGEKLKPKFHHLIHYARLIFTNGPPKNCWTMRHESAHRPLKLMCQTENKKNLLHTMASNYKLKFDHFIKCFDRKSFVTHGSFITNQTNSQFPENSSVMWTEINGSKYHVNSLLVACIRENEYPKFGVIKEMNVFENKIHFTLDLFNTVKFERHMNAYIIEKINETVCLNYCNLPYKFVCTKIKKSGFTYVTSKYAL